jgi:hypothetical protein
MLHYNTITPLLHSILADLMSADVFKDFRLGCKYLSKVGLNEDFV